MGEKEEEGGGVIKLKNRRMTITAQRHNEEVEEKGDRHGCFVCAN